MKPWLLAVLVSTAAHPASAAELVPGPVCAAPAVLERVAEELHRAGEYAVIERASVGELPGAQPDTVRCALRVRRTVYDTAQSGALPQELVRVVQYTLNRRRNGVFIRLEHDPTYGVHPSDRHARSY